MSSHTLAALGVLCLFLRTLAVERVNVDVECRDDDETCDSGLVMLQLGKQQQQVNMTVTAETNKTSKTHVNESKGEQPDYYDDEEVDDDDDHHNDDDPLSGTYTIQAKVNKHFLDADNDFGLVTRDAQSGDSQKWIIKSVGKDTYTIQHKINNRFVDSYWSGDYPCCTLPASNQDGQEWIIKFVGKYSYSGTWWVKQAGVTSRKWTAETVVERYYTIQQKGNNRFMDEKEFSINAWDFNPWNPNAKPLDSVNDQGVVTRDAQNDDSQKWIIRSVGDFCPECFGNIKIS